MYLEEMHIILRLLKPNDIIEHIVPSFNIFIDETNDLRAKFLKTLPSIVKKMLECDFDAGVDQIILNVFPALESMMKKTKDEVLDLCIETLKDICFQIGKKEAASSFNNLLMSFT